MAPFPPLRVRGGKLRLRRALRRRRRALAAGLAMTAAALAAMGPGVLGPSPGDAPGPGAVAAERESRPHVRMVSAPVRIADAAAVRLLRPGDRVDVIAAAPSAMGAGGRPRVVASGARVKDVPAPGGPSADGGALVVLAVPRSTAAALAGAGSTSRLAVTVC